MSSREIGDEWEKELARKIGGKKTPASGSRWYSKLDVRGKKTLWSAKATEAASFRVDADMVREMQGSVNTPGALGMDVTPILAVRLGTGQEVAVVGLDDLLHLLSESVLGGGPIVAKTRDKRPQLFRETHE